MTGSSWEMSCPVPMDGNEERITLAHGEGARLTRRLVSEHILPALNNPVLSEISDAASLLAEGRRLALTTDSFVVSPLFFPGGDIGSLAVFGTVNDLLVSGAKPRWLTLSLIIEEGFPIPLLDRIIESIAKAAMACAVLVAAGDTKVVPRGKCDGLFVNTTGLGELMDPVPPGPSGLQERDVLIVSGPIGHHGLAVLCAREELGFDPMPRSDSSPLIDPIRKLRESVGPHIRAMRDATRGGVSAVLHEWALASRLTMAIRERDIPLSPDVRGASEVLGLDPIHAANEGTFLAAIAPEFAEAALLALKAVPQTRNAAMIGEVISRQIAPVLIRRLLGRDQPLDEPSGAAFPRIC
jgi:hydrogenase expression/formation protein HypE